MMGKPQKKILSVLGEIGGELLVTVVFLGIGLLILHFLGIDLGADEVDLEWAVFLGAIVVLVLFFVVVLILHIRKKHEKNEKNELNDSNDLNDVNEGEAKISEAEIENRKDESSREL